MGRRISRINYVRDLLRRASCFWGVRGVEIDDEKELKELGKDLQRLQNAYKDTMRAHRKTSRLGKKPWRRVQKMNRAG